MRQFFTVLKFELGNYFKKKSFVISTLIFAALIIGLLSLPNFFDMSKIIPGIGGGSSEVEQPSEDKGNKDKFGILDEKNIVDDNLLKTIMGNVEWVKVSSDEELKNLINEKELKCGFKINSPSNYSYYVENSSFTDMNTMTFNEVMKKVYQKEEITNAGIDYNKVDTIYNTEIKSDIQVLGKDNANNFIYAYILLFIIYMMTIIYGQTISMAVASEKSNRAIEVLVTSTSPNSLIFGKVIAGAIASVAQVGIILASGIIGYKINSGVWNGMLDMVFKVPSNLLLVFALFGVIGYLFYAFLFGALGALVSKTEDIGTSVGPVMLVFVGVFLLSMYGLSNSDNIIIKIASFIPFSSPMAMIVRVALGAVSTIEIAISFVILVVSTGLAGIVGAKIYRMGTLMYGNPVKITKIFSLMKKNK
ncbi:MAG: ABC transporter permease [Clostridium sp.]